jgi:type IV pilus assembly protein PilE
MARAEPVTGAMTAGRSASAGFTLVELLIAVVVVAILAAIAIPSYSAYVIRGQRAAAKAALVQAAQYLERNYTTNGCYEYGTVGECTAVAGTPITPPVTSSPNEGQATYAITVGWTAPAGSGFNQGQYYLLSAVPCGTAGNCVGGSTFTDATCGTLLLDNTGQQGINVSGSPVWTGTTVSSCWQH